jgi:hypothetical protein
VIDWRSVPTCAETNFDVDAAADGLVVSSTR